MNKKIGPLPSYPYCFVCGQNNTRGLRTRFASRGDEVWATFTPEPFMAGYENVVHGGIASTLLDEAMIWAAYASKDQFGVTAELTVRFKRSMTLDRTYQINGKMVEDRGKLWIVEAKIIDDEKGLYATGTGKIVPMDPESAEKFKERLVF